MPPQSQSLPERGRDAHGNECKLNQDGLPVLPTFVCEGEGKPKGKLLDQSKGQSGHGKACEGQRSEDYNEHVFGGGQCLVSVVPSAAT